jgi:hypothetical protein
VVGKGRVPKLRELFTPPFFGIVAGLVIVVSGLQPVVFHRQLPFYYFMKALERFGMITYPTILVCLGAIIGHVRITKDDRKQLVAFAALVSTIRFLLIPVLFLLAYWGILRHMSLASAQMWVLFLECHVPPASNLSMMAAQAGINEDQVSFTTLIAYIVYLIVLPVYLLLFLSLMGVS